MDPLEWTEELQEKANTYLQTNLEKHHMLSKQFLIETSNASRVLRSLIGFVASKCSCQVGKKEPAEYINILRVVFDK